MGPSEEVESELCLEHTRFSRRRGGKGRSRERSQNRQNPGLQKGTVLVGVQNGKVPKSKGPAQGQRQGWAGAGSRGLTLGNSGAPGIHFWGGSVLAGDTAAERAEGGFPILVPEVCSL